MEKPKTIEEMYELLLCYGVNEETIRTVTAINGYNEKSMEDILYVNFGYRSFEDID